MHVEDRTQGVATGRDEVQDLLLYAACHGEGRRTRECHSPLQGRGNSALPLLDTPRELQTLSSRADCAIGIIQRSQVDKSDNYVCHRRSSERIIVKSPRRTGELVQLSRRFLELSFRNRKVSSTNRPVLPRVEVVVLICGLVAQVTTQQDTRAD